jgi:DNA-binding protein H-NS
MMSTEFESLSIDELWRLHETLANTLAERLSSERAILEARLKQLSQPLQAKTSASKRARGPYPAVVPKYRNPEDSSETWSGRGRQPRWLVALLKSGKSIEDFRISTKSVPRASNVTALGKREAG